MLHRIPSFPYGPLRFFILLCLTAALSALPAQAQSPPSRPILYVHGFCGDESWPFIRPDLANFLRAHFPESYPRPSDYDVAYYDGKVHFFIGSNEIPEGLIRSNTRFFGIKFYSPEPDHFKDLNVAQVSIFNKAGELAHVLGKITEITHVKDVIVIGHSMGGLVVRAYLEQLATPIACTNTADYSACQRDQTPYLGDVGEVMTLDTPHGGAAIADTPPLPLPACFLADSVNRRELRPESELMLTYLTPGAAKLPPELGIQSLRNFYVNAGLLDSTDAVLGLDTQSLLTSVPGLPGVPEQYPNVDNEYNFLGGVCGLTPLHLLLCLGQQPGNLASIELYAQLARVGELTRIEVQATLDGVPWPGAVRYSLTGPGPTLEGTQAPQTFIDVPTGRYTLQVVSGGPIPNAPVIGPDPVQTIQGGAWTIVYNLSFTSAPLVRFEPAGVDFGNQLLGTSSAPRSITLANLGSARLVVTSITLEGSAAADFGFSPATTCALTGETLAVGQSCQLSIVFTPTALGARSAQVNVTSSAVGSPHIASLSGAGADQGVPGINLVPVSLDFGNQPARSPSAPRTITLTNTGGAVLLIGGITITGSQAADFALDANTTCPVSGGTLAPAANCLVSVVFTPSGIGARAAQVIITSNAPGSPHSAPLAGNGTGPIFINLGETISGTLSTSAPRANCNSGTPADRYTFTLASPTTVTINLSSSPSTRSSACSTQRTH
jgi:pimeloyl-ACP methyl ester carboxylesterase